MNKLELEMNRMFSFLIGFIAAALLLTILYITVTFSEINSNASSKMRYVPARSIIITP